MRNSNFGIGVLHVKRQISTCFSRRNFLFVAKDVIDLCDLDL